MHVGFPLLVCGTINFLLREEWPWMFVGCILFCATSRRGNWTWVISARLELWELDVHVFCLRKIQWEQGDRARGCLAQSEWIFPGVIEGREKSLWRIKKVGGGFVNPSLHTSELPVYLHYLLICPIKEWYLILVIQDNITLLLASNPPPSTPLIWQLPSVSCVSVY